MQITRQPNDSATATESSVDSESRTRISTSPTFFWDRTLRSSSAKVSPPFFTGMITEMPQASVAGREPSGIGSTRTWALRSRVSASSFSCNCRPISLIFLSSASSAPSCRSEMTFFAFNMRLAHSRAHCIS